MVTRMHIEDENFASVTVTEGGLSALHCSSTSILELLGNQLLEDSDDDSTFTIADFGSADGSMFVPLVNEMIRLFRLKKGKDREIVVIMEDQPKNDFNSLFNVLFGLTNNRQQVKMTTDERVFVFVNASNMFSQCLPSNSVDFAFSSMATHHLSELPCNIKNGLFLENADEDEYTLFKNAAKKDWNNFVLSRGKELKPGGKLVVMDLVKDLDDKIGHTLHGGFNSLTLIARQMLAENVITELEFQSMTYGAYLMRTKDDFCKVFKENKDINKLGLQLESFVYKKSVYVPGLTEVEKTDDYKRSEYASTIANFHRIWLYHTIYEGLSDNRKEEEKRSVADLYFKKLEKFVSSAETYPDVECIYAEIIISKRKDI